MNKLTKIYAITSVLFLIVLAFSPIKSRLSQWYKIQKEYTLLSQKLPQKVKPAPMALQQIWATRLDRIDRCTTCHLGILENKKTSLPEPFKAHPKIQHDVIEYGCTICHGGQGLATNYDDAHLPTEFWDEPVLPNRYIQSSCGQCHLNDSLKEAPLLAQGRDLAEDLNCSGCHNVPNVRKSFVPSLDGAGSKIASRRWIVQWLSNPQQFQPKPRMPNFFLSEEEANALADFLMSFKTFANDVRLDPLPQSFVDQKDDETFIELGKTRFREARCISCHKVDGRGGNLATDLAKVASKATAGWIFNYLKNPKQLQPGVPMPQYGFTDQEAAAITAYMESELVDWDAPEEPEKATAPPPDFYQKGLNVYNKYNCSGCHQLSDPKVKQNIAPDLATIGSKAIYEIDFAETQVPHTRYDYINSKLRNPRSFGENSRMPQYILEEQQRQALTVYFLSLKENRLPQEYIRRTAAPAQFRPQGRVGNIFSKYACLECHSVMDTGNHIAPDLTIVGSQLNRQWTEQYFKLPYTLRPIVKERMPNLFIQENEIKTLVDYFYTVFLDDSVSADNSLEFQPEDPKEGEGLYWEKYGCQSCHLIKGRGGYVGPPLDDAGDRLQPGWALQWLINPQKYKPDTIEPRSGMSRKEAEKIVAYLMTLKKAGSR